MSEPAYYDKTAWRPDENPGPKRRPRPRLDTRSASFRSQWTAGQKLAKHYVKDLVPGNFLELWPPDLEEDSATYVEVGKGAEKRKEPVAWMTHESFRWTTLPTSAWVWLLSKAIARVIIITGVPLAIMTNILLLIADVGTFDEMVYEAWLPAIKYIGAPCLILWFGVGFLERFSPDLIYKSPKGPTWEFNRRTGMVTLFCDPQKRGQAGKVQWQSPFEEFDCFVHMGPTSQGLPLYYGVIVHRHREEAMYLTALQAASSSDRGHKALWNFWCQYMDSTAPLPDIPLLEPHRHEDPVTAEYDKQTGRSPRYWRDMDEATYAVKTKQMYERCRLTFG